MTLDAWLTERKISDADFADTIKVTRQSLHRYKTGRMPKPAVLARIVNATAGAVMPNDFLPKAPAGEVAA